MCSDKDICNLLLLLAFVCLYSSYEGFLKDNLIADGGIPCLNVYTCLILYFSLRNICPVKLKRVISVDCDKATL